MESRKWEALLAAVDAGSLSHVAERLGYTQSGLTHMMNSLEKEVGFSILTRGHYGVKLTENGERLMTYIREFTKAGSRLEREIAAVNTSKSGTIRVAAYASIAVHWLPGIVRRFREEAPETQVDIMLVNSAEELYASVREDRADLGFGGRAPGGEGAELHWLHLRDDPMMAVLPRDYPLNGRGSFPLEEFEGKDFLISSQGFDPIVLDRMEALGVHPNVCPFAVDDLTVITLVENGLGVSVLAELVLEGSRKHIRALPVQPRAFRELGVLSCPGRETSRKLRSFRACAERTVGDSRKP